MWTMHCKQKCEKTEPIYFPWPSINNPTIESVGCIPLEETCQLHERGSATTTRCCSLRIGAVCRLLIRVSIERNHSWKSNGWDIALTTIARASYIRARKRGGCWWEL